MSKRKNTTIALALVNHITKNVDPHLNKLTYNSEYCGHTIKNSLYLDNKNVYYKINRTTALIYNIASRTFKVTYSIDSVLRRFNPLKIDVDVFENSIFNYDKSSCSSTLKLISELTDLNVLKNIETEKECIEKFDYLLRKYASNLERDFKTYDEEYDFSKFDITNIVGGFVIKNPKSELSFTKLNKNTWTILYNDVDYSYYNIADITNDEVYHTMKVKELISYLESNGCKVKKVLLPYADLLIIDVSGTDYYVDPSFKFTFVNDSEKNISTYFNWSDI